MGRVGQNLLKGISKDPCHKYGFQRFKGKIIGISSIREITPK
jgi:hypothetical protein